MNFSKHLTYTAAQYDLSTSTFSPDGRVFQTDYAQKAVDNSGHACLLPLPPLAYCLSTSVSIHSLLQSCHVETACFSLLIHVLLLCGDTVVIYFDTQA